MRVTVSHPGRTRHALLSPILTLHASLGNIRTQTFSAPAPRGAARCPLPCGGGTPAGAAGRGGAGWGRAAPTTAGPQRGEGGLQAKPARVNRPDGEKPLEGLCDPVKCSERINMSKPHGGPGTFLATPSRLNPSRSDGLRGAADASAAAPRSVLRGEGGRQVPRRARQSRRLAHAAFHRQSPAHPPAAAVLRGRFCAGMLLPAGNPGERVRP